MYNKLCTENEVKIIGLESVSIEKIVVYQDEKNLSSHTPFVVCLGYDEAEYTANEVWLKYMSPKVILGESSELGSQTNVTLTDKF